MLFWPENQNGSELDRWVCPVEGRRFVLASPSQLPLVVDEDWGSYTYRANQSKAFLDFTLLQTSLHLGGDVGKSTPSGEVKPQFFAIGFHSHLWLSIRYFWRFYLTLIHWGSYVLTEMRHQYIVEQSEQWDIRCLIENTYELRLEVDKSTPMNPSGQAWTQSRTEHAGLMEIFFVFSER